MNIVDLVKTIESIENPQNLKIIREGACFYMCLGENKKYFYFLKLILKIKKVFLIHSHWMI
ncbi:hypothetical protein PAJ32_00520 [Campylobacter jejuni]|nr:hypothetical protein [Campylobacter jejuni]